MSITPTILCQGQIDASNRSGYRLGLPFRAGGFEGGSRSAYHVFVHTVGKTHSGRRAETAPRHPKYEVFFERGCEARVINAARRSTEDIERPLRFPRRLRQSLRDSCGLNQGGLFRKPRLKRRPSAHVQSRPARTHYNTRQRR